MDGCTNLNSSPIIPSNVTDMEGTFYGCTSLVTAPIIPSSVTNMTYTLGYCRSLVTAPIIPSNVTNMRQTFYGCTSLVTAPIIPSNVTVLQETFYGCTSLTGEIEINTNLIGEDIAWHYGTFTGTTKEIKITGTTTRKAELAQTSINFGDEGPVTSGNIKY